MKALVLAGGRGTRLRPISHHLPKQLVPIANKPVLEYVLENVRALGVREVGVVVGTWADAVTDALGDGSRFGVRITYLRQERPLGLAHTVLLAKRFLAEDDFVMYLGDVMLLDGVTEAAERFADLRPSAHVVVREVPDPHAFGVVETGPGGIVRSLAEKPAHPRSDTVLVGVYFFTAAVHEAVASVSAGARGELEITDAVQWLVDHGHEVRASRYRGYWKDTGRTEDLLRCNREVLRGLEHGSLGEVDVASRVEGPVRLGRGSRVIRSEVVGPVVIGPGTVVQDSRIGPHTSIGADCTVLGCELADAIVLEGTPLSDLIGLRGAVLGGVGTASSVFGAPRGRKLMIANGGSED
ncbi:glucose-1-phosphate thymidylyltransferase [Nocardiopsis sp. RV163]|uniref:glucose-1-phosphate thymidylyltransferase n=1 Tax=Nocardiopsis sp. RV163 TaxID=1661388 RepID=UPI00064BC289|nr:glucose-1-phosphate thymidylyltransferase [Nocardiopsis sp. RV163]